MGSAMNFRPTQATARRDRQKILPWTSSSTTRWCQGKPTLRGGTRGFLSWTVLLGPLFVDAGGYTVPLKFRSARRKRRCS